MAINGKLKEFGFDEREENIYIALLGLGSASVSLIAKRANEKRTTTYYVLEDLKKRGYVDIVDSGKVKHYRSVNPEQVLSKNIDKQIQDIEKIRKEVQHDLPDLVSLFRNSGTRPVVKYFNSWDGVDIINNDILEEGSDLLLFRSIYDVAYIGRITEYIKEQTERGIQTHAITPYNKEAVYNFLHRDQERLVKRRFAPPDIFTLPTQINIYGDRVAFIVLKDQVRCMVIENKDIATTFRSVFWMTWRKLDSYHKEVLKHTR